MLVSCLLLLAQAQASGDVPAVPSAPATVHAPRTIAWSELGATFDPALVLPEALRLSGEGDKPALDLLREWRELANFVAAPAAGEAPRCFGDLARLWPACRDEAQRKALFDACAAAQPELWTRLAPWVREILDDRALASPRWTPDDDRADDGCAFGMPLTLDGAPAPYGTLDGSHLVQQAVVFVRADVEALKAAENDYTAYTRRPGSSYEEIHAVAGSLVEGRDPQGLPFRALKAGFKADLPWPFGTYRCDLRVLNRFDTSGGLVCDVRAWNDGPRDDFVWLAGRDHYFPVRDSGGAWQGTLVVRWFGFDLRGVPDTDSARRAGLRAGLLCLKREAEALQRARRDAPRDPGRVLPEFPVRGWK